MSSTIDHRPPGSGAEDPTGRFPAVPGTGPYPGPIGPYPAPAPRPGSVAPYPGPAAPHHPHPPYGRHPLPAGPGPARRGGVRTGWVVAGAVVGLLLILAATSALATPRTTTVPGSVTLQVSSSSLTPGTSCQGAGWYSWLEPGVTTVTIYDASGTVVGTTTLGDGTAYSSGTGWSSSYADTCVFPFTLTDVPSGDDFYRVKAGSNAGDGVTFTGDQLRSGGAHLTVGSGS